MESAAQKASRQDPGIIHDQAVTRAQKLRQIKEMLMLPLAGNLVQCQKTRRIPPVQRRLSDQFLRQIKEKVMCFQA